MFGFLLALLATGVPILALATFVEVIWRDKKYHKEFSRKFLHITVGTYAAFWPWFIGWGDIELLAIGAIGALVLSRRLQVYKSMHLVRPLATGEVLAAASIGLVALITHQPWVYTAAILHLSLGDGLAAMVGTKFGGANTYRVLGERKSRAGTLTFIACSVAILALYFTVGHGSDWPNIFWLPLVAAALENIGIAGTDNLLVPVGIALALRFL